MGMNGPGADGYFGRRLVGGAIFGVIIWLLSLLFPGR
jgi:hypothetical protein